MTPQEERNRKFVNDLAFQLEPSNDTMHAIRLFREELPPHLTSEVNLTIEQVEKWAKENALFDIKLSDLLSFLTTLKK